MIKWEFAARGKMPPVTVYWSDTGDLYTPPGMTVDEMRAIPGTGPQIEAAGGGGGRGGVHSRLSRTHLPSNSAGTP